MFSRKSTKSEATLPKPPTKAEILEDLETFSLDSILDKPRRRLGDESSINASAAMSDSLANSMDASKSVKRDHKESESDRHLEEWWETFEKFLADINKLEIYQKQFQAKKIGLAKLDESIGLMADDIQTRITDSLQKAMDEIPESEQDLK